MLDRNFTRSAEPSGWIVIIVSWSLAMQLARTASPTAETNGSIFLIMASSFRGIHRDLDMQTEAQGGGPRRPAPPLREGENPRGGAFSARPDSGMALASPGRQGDASTGNREAMIREPMVHDLLQPGSLPAAG